MTRTDVLELLPCGRSVVVAAVSGLLVLSGAFGCGGNGEQAEKDAEKAKSSEQSGEKEYDPDTILSERKRDGNLEKEPFEVETYDLNRDQQADQWVYGDGGGTTQIVERDMNFDGQVDVWQHPAPSGEVVEEEMDLDMDGTVDVVAYYKNGTIRRKEMAVNFKNDYAITKFYTGEGSLLRVERDEDGDGTVDVWEYYDGDGNRERIGWDEDGDGVPDSFDNLP